VQYVVTVVQNADGPEARSGRGRKYVLTRTQVKFIRSSKEKQSVLAVMFGVDQQTISLIKLGKIWRD